MLPLTEFTKHGQTKDGLNCWCKECSNARAKEFRSTPSGVYTQVKGRVKFYKTKPFKITRREFIKWYEPLEKSCAYCGVHEENLQELNDSHNNKALRLSIDCIDNDLGYIRGNLVLACLRCNGIKSDLLSHEAMREIGQKHIKPIWDKKLRGSYKGEWG